MGARTRIDVLQCSIIDTGTTCIVNASNDSATLGGGVSRAIFDECGGTVLQDEMQTKLDEIAGVLDEGDCIVTTAGSSSRFRWVLHVASVDYRGPKAVLRGGQVHRTVTSVERVRAGVDAALSEADAIAARDGSLSIGFPILGAGSGGLAPRVAFQTMLATMREWLRDHGDTQIERIVFAIPEPDVFNLCRADA